GATIYDKELKDEHRRAEELARALHRLKRAFAAMTALLVLAEVLGGYALTKRSEAEGALNNALMTQSLFLADLARQQRTDGDAVTAALLALEALLDPPATTARPYAVLALDALLKSPAVTTRPYASEAEVQLDGALRALREIVVLGGHQDTVF